MSRGLKEGDAAEWRLLIVKSEKKIIQEFVSSSSSSSLYRRNTGVSFVLIFSPCRGRIRLRAKFWTTVLQGFFFKVIVYLTQCSTMS